MSPRSWSKGSPPRIRGPSRHISRPCGAYPPDDTSLLPVENGLPMTSAPPGGLAVATRGLTKRFGSRTVVDHLDIAIPAGSVCGFVGPNGAGKTTTIRMLLGLIRPTEGTGMVLARLGGIDAGQVDPALERVGLAERSGDAFKRYSLGMKQRLGIAAALLGNPSLLVLDEPANGLDPAGIVEVRRLMRSFADEGITVFVSSHLLGEIEHICDHLLMIQQGKLAFQGAVGELFATQIAELLARPEHPEQAEAL